jgi:hypothetical protein
MTYQEFIDKLKKFVQEGRRDINDYERGQAFAPECTPVEMHKGIIEHLEQLLDQFLSTYPPKIEPCKHDNHDWALHADGRDDDRHEINDCLTCKYKYDKPSMFGIACKNDNPCEYYSLWEPKDKEDLDKE